MNELFITKCISTLNLYIPLIQISSDPLYPLYPPRVPHCNFPSLQFQLSFSLRLIAHIYMLNCKPLIKSVKWNINDFYVVLINLM